MLIYFCQVAVKWFALDNVFLVSCSISSKTTSWLLKKLNNSQAHIFGYVMVTLINLDWISFKECRPPCFLLCSPVPKDRDKFYFKLRQSVEKKVVISVQQLCNKELRIERWGTVSVMFSWHVLCFNSTCLSQPVMNSTSERWKQHLITICLLPFIHVTDIDLITISN